jgi:putative endonuclease
MKNINYFVYILSNKNNTTLYAGVTNNITRRVWEHKNSRGTSFTSKYQTTKLVYFEVFNNIYEAIKREKQIKGGSRLKKVNLIIKSNPNFNDLYKSILY